MTPSQGTLLLGYLRSPIELVPKDEPATTSTVTALEIPDVVSVLGVLPESTLPLRTSVRRYWIRPRPEVGVGETLIASLLSVLRESSTLAVVALGQEQCGYVTAAYAEGDRIALLLHTLPYRTSLGDAMEYLQPVTRPMGSSAQDDPLRAHLLVHPDDALDEVARLLNDLPASVNTLDACLAVVSGVVAVHHYGQLVGAIHQQIQDKQKSIPTMSPLYQTLDRQRTQFLSNCGEFAHEIRAETNSQANTPNPAPSRVSLSSLLN